jgi:hypothetical protein
MAIRLVEPGIALGFGALDGVITSKAGTTGWGGASGMFNQKWSLVLELAGVAAGAWGRKVGLSTEVREPLLYTSLGLLGVRGARYAMAGNLTKPGSWAGMGGDDSNVGGDAFGNLLTVQGGGAPAGPVGPALKIRGGVGGYPVYPPTAEAPGIAG